MKFTLRKFPLLVVAFFCAGRLAYAQGVDTTVDVPTTAHRSALIEIPTAQTASQSNLDNNVTMAGEYKSTKNVVEQEKPAFWNWYVDFGYESEYNFRGTDLMPNSDGGVFINAAVTKWDFTLGLFVIHQLGDAHAPGWSIGEGGGGGSGLKAFNGFFTLAPETVQTRFNELDVYLRYHRKFGPLDVTVGNVGFFIDRSAETFVTATFGPFVDVVGPFSTVEDEQFDRLFATVSTSIIPYIQPEITYYQTIYTEGNDPFRHVSPPDGILFPNGAFFLGHERNDELGGYLEGRLRGNFPITDWLEFHPFGTASVSFHDRTEPIPDAVKFKDILRGRTLSGWNVVQAGAEVWIRLFHIRGTSDGPYAPPDVEVKLIPFGEYSYHISLPTAGTDRNEWWGGAKLAVTF